MEAQQNGHELIEMLKVIGLPEMSGIYE